MSRVIDVDSHWTFAWEFKPAKGPLAKFADDLPRTQDLLAWFFAGDLIEALPEEARPDPALLFGLPAGEEVPEHWRRLQHTGKVSDRIEWMDRIGIEFALVNPGGYGSTFPLIRDANRRAQFVCAANDVLLEVLDGHTARCSPISVIDLVDLDAAVAEMTRMRGHGSRASCCWLALSRACSSMVTLSSCSTCTAAVGFSSPCCAATTSHRQLCVPPWPALVVGMPCSIWVTAAVARTAVCCTWVMEVSLMASHWKKIGPLPHVMG